MTGPTSDVENPTRSVRRILTVGVLALCTYVMVGASISFLGWMLDHPHWADWDTDGITIQPNACVAAFLSGLALFCLQIERPIAGRALGIVVGVIGASVIFEYVTNVDLGVDTPLMFDRTWGRVGVVSPGRMGPPGALSWTLVGIALVLTSFPKHSQPRRVAPSFALVTGVISTLGLVGYMYGASTLYTIPTATVIALQTASFIACASLALLLLVPEFAPVHFLVTLTPAGFITRRIVPAIVVGPIVVGLLRIQGERAGLYDAPFGTAMRTVLEMVVATGCLWWVAAAIDRQARRRAELEQASRASQERLVETLEHISEAFVTFDRNWRYSYVNAEAERLLGKPRAELLGRVPWEVIPTLADSPVRTLLEHAAEERASTAHEHFDPASKRWMAWKASPGADGSLAVYFEDVTERKEAESRREELFAREQRARSDAENAARLKDEFLATLSHELRTPLNAIIGWSQILKSDLKDQEKARAAVDIIERNGRLQAQLITDLLDISRIVSGKLRIESKEVDLDAVIEAATDSMLPAARAKGVQLRKIATRPLVMVHGDPARLQQVVWNLLSNAVKFTPGGGSVEVSVTPVDGHVEIRVTDTGQGIPPEFLPHIFQRFRQADASMSRVHGGLGIGLAIVKQLVELHGGTVRAQSAGLNAGSTFVIELPLAGSRSLPAREGELSSSSADGAERLANLHVLVVDDEADTIGWMQRVLQHAGARVTTALSASAALEQLHDETFDVIVSDIGMPAQNGYEFIAEVRRRSIRTPALALTAFAHAQDRAKALESGFQAHIAKPVDVEEWLASIESLVAGRSAAPGA